MLWGIYISVPNFKTEISEACTYNTVLKCTLFGGLICYSCNLDVSV